MAAGDEAAFRRFFDHYAPSIFTLVERLTRSRPDTEEILQDTFMKIWSMREKLADIGQPGHYCYVIARNMAMDRLRKFAREKTLQNSIREMFPQSHDHSAEAAMISRDYQLRLNEALQQLPPKQQEVYRMSRENGLSHEEISEQTGLSKSRINNILVAVLKHIKSRLGLPSGLTILGAMAHFFHR
ncbi:RNA polymerase sigma-70 factor [Chitinophaga cymbidii]|uniref:RNA polymerase sigma-70 factor n=2 Tax=Chitinophaga cymbidii TaxID=1096750 RepID=A0A512RFV2_9BACT|nr:RNA polymerase sigma-70 factor [Chitinophaga cymbidii]